MPFTSIHFYIFLGLVFFFNWFVNFKKASLQNLILLIAGYIFYGFWSWHYLLILIFISLFNYVIGLLLQKFNSHFRRISLFVLALIIDIGSLAYFKYYHFFIKEFAALLGVFGISSHISSLSLILPVGISFYIFLQISYITDVYRKKIIASGNLKDTLLAFSFFPIILAGPIQRPQLLLPQLKTKRVFSYSLAVEGLRQILWGLFMKMVVADNLAPVVNDAFKHYYSSTGSNLFIGVVFFAIQLYADFAGYSEIAIGASKLFGIHLIRNFSYPYFAKNIADFWKRWHISLTSWFRDYVFLPIAYSLSGKIRSERIMFISTEILIYIAGISVTWLLTGLWHGANLTYIAWGAIHGFFLIVHQIVKKPKKKLLKKLHIKQGNVFISIFERLYMFCIILTAWVFFRSDSIALAFTYFRKMLNPSLFSIPKNIPLVTIVIVTVFFIIEVLQRNKQYTLQIDYLKLPRILRWSIYYAILISLLYLGGHNQVFIYLQY